LALSTVRYYRAPSAQTVVDVFCRVPLALVSPFVGNGAGGGGGAFRFAVSVRDSGGLTLVSQSWSEAVTATMLQARGASTGEHLSFAAKAGRYSVEVTFTDSATGRVAHQQAVVRAYASSPAASDLLLGTNIRPLGETDTTVGPGEVRKGSLVIQTSGDPVLTPQAARLGYYLELYPLRTETLTVMLRVLDPVGKQVIAAPAQSLAVAAGGGVTQGLVDLSGLPAGRYQLEVKTAGGGGDSAVTRSAGFGMAGFETVQEAAAAVAASQTQDYFADKTEAQLDTL